MSTKVWTTTVCARFLYTYTLVLSLYVSRSIHTVLDDIVAHYGAARRGHVGDATGSARRRPSPSSLLRSGLYHWYSVRGNDRRQPAA
jgi:hypothetical protein